MCAMVYFFDDHLSLIPGFYPQGWGVVPVPGAEMRRTRTTLSVRSQCGPVTGQVYMEELV